MKAGFFDLADTDLRAHTAWLRRLALQLVGDPPRAEDAVQDTLVAALAHPPALDRDVRPWLARVLANFTRSRHRADGRRRQRELVVSEQPRDRPPGVDELLVRHEAARVVADQVSALREPHRGLVLLRFAEGLTPKEIARRRGLPEGTVRRQLKEAVDQLRAAVAARYTRDARDWRLGLQPLLAGTRAAEGAFVGAWKGLIVMTMKSKLGLGAGLVVLVLVLLLARSGWRAAAEQGTAATAANVTASHAEPRAGGPAGGDPGAAPVAAGRPRSSPPAAAPPVFTTGSAPADPATCEQKLPVLRALASKRMLVSPALFARARPNAKTESALAPIVERTMSRLAGKTGHQLECRASVCRVGVVTENDERGEPAWFQALAQDAAFKALAGTERNSRFESAPTRDALTGTKLVQHWFYFTVPLAADEEHPFEGEAGAGTCAERIAAVQKALDEQQEEHKRMAKDELERRVLFKTLPVNQELTRRMEATFRPLIAAAGVPNASGGGVWECRGQQDCRWRGPSALAKALDLPRFRAALASQGLAPSRWTVRSQRAKEGGEEHEAELNVSLVEAGKARADGEAATQRTKIFVEKGSVEPEN